MNSHAVGGKSQICNENYNQHPTQHTFPGHMRDLASAHPGHPTGGCMPYSHPLKYMQNSAIPPSLGEIPNTGDPTKSYKVLLDQKWELLGRMSLM